ncbi:hypothetical protein F5884DRAFT_661859 [Xylogone sp. PMI_703]|nr:hypothetical protein F5884DRAFT_661859 [Xylogone sp. PMI_703]
METEHSYGSRTITLSRMRQQSNIACTQDDWTGISSPAARRRLQNRINQRAYPGRRKAREVVPGPVGDPAGAKSEMHDHTSTDDRRPVDDFWRLFSSVTSNFKLDYGVDYSRLITIARWCANRPQEAVSEFEKLGRMNNYIFGAPTADHLLVVVKFNIFRALLLNMETLDIPVDAIESDDAVSPFVTTSQKMLAMRLPSALQPTKSQMEVEHHPWIDMIPIPRMRDNIIRAGHSFDEMELCGDFVGFFSGSRIEKSVIIWGESWDPDGWEITEDFVRRWSWTVRGCHELFASTNRWRARRGEEPMDFGSLECEEIE